MDQSPSVFQSSTPFSRMLWLSRSRSADVQVTPSPPWSPLLILSRIQNDAAAEREGERERKRATSLPRRDYNRGEKRQRGRRETLNVVLRAVRWCCAYFDLTINIGYPFPVGCRAPSEGDGGTRLNKKKKKKRGHQKTKSRCSTSSVLCVRLESMR